MANVKKYRREIYNVGPIWPKPLGQQQLSIASLINRDVRLILSIIQNLLWEL